MTIPIPGKSHSQNSGMSPSPASRSLAKIEDSPWSRIRSYLRSYIYVPEEGGHLENPNGSRERSGLGFMDHSQDSRL